MKRLEPTAKGMWGLPTLRRQKMSNACGGRKLYWHLTRPVRHHDGSESK